MVSKLNSFTHFPILFTFSSLSINRSNLLSCLSRRKLFQVAYRRHRIHTNSDDPLASCSLLHHWRFKHSTTNAVLKWEAIQFRSFVVELLQLLMSVCRYMCVCVSLFDAMYLCVHRTIYTSVYMLVSLMISRMHNDLNQCFASSY